VSTWTRAHLGGVRHVKGIHDLHAATVAAGPPVLTAHVVVDDSTTATSPRLLEQLQDCLAGIPRSIALSSTVTAERLRPL
jgi:Co/Zn/Cd efflux system component